MLEAALAAVAILGLVPGQSTGVDPKSLLTDMLRLQEEYKRCLVDQTVVLGRENSESAETILRGVSAKCFAKEQQLRAIYGAMPISQVHANGLVQRDRKLGEDAGVAALLEARSSLRP
jgi:hypothetical protein